MEKTTLAMFESTVHYEESSLIWVRPVCDFFQIDVRNQHRKIKSDPILGKLVEKSIPDLGRIDENGRILLSKKGFLRWIQIINPNIVTDELKDNFIRYQELLADYFYGSVSEESQISSLVAESGHIDNQLTVLRNRRRIVNRLLKNALITRYQYTLNFRGIPQIS